MSRPRPRPILTADILERVFSDADKHTLATCLRVNSLFFELAGSQLYRRLKLHPTSFLRDSRQRSISPLEGYRAVEHQRSFRGKPRKRNTKMRLLRYVRTILTPWWHEHTVGRLNPPLASILPNCKTLYVYGCPRGRLEMCSRINCRVFRNMALDTLVLDAPSICCPHCPPELGAFSRLVCLSRLQDIWSDGRLLSRDSEQLALLWTAESTRLAPSVRRIDLVLGVPARDDFILPLSRRGLDRYIRKVASIRSDVSVLVVNAQTGMVFDDHGHSAHDFAGVDNLTFISMREYLRDPGTRGLFSRDDVRAWVGSSAG